MVCTPPLPLTQQPRPLLQGEQSSCRAGQVRSPNMCSSPGLRQASSVCAGQLLQWAGAQLAAAGSRMDLPAPHVGRLSLSGGTLQAHMAGEPIPRVVRGVRASLKLGRGYDSVQLDLAGECASRLL